MDPTESEGPARQLMKVLVNAGFNVDEPAQDDWVQSEALRTLGLEGEALDADLLQVCEAGPVWIDVPSRQGGWRRRARSSRVGSSRPG